MSFSTLKAGFTSMILKRNVLLHVKIWHLEVYNGDRTIRGVLGDLGKPFSKR